MRRTVERSTKQRERDMERMRVVEEKNTESSERLKVPFVVEFVKNRAHGQTLSLVHDGALPTLNAAVPMEILYLDDTLLVVQKPAGLLAQPDHTGDPDVLTLATERMREASGTPDPFVGLVHRLDRPTSGIMVLARSSEAARALSAQFRERTISKQYLALVEGTLRGIGTWTDYIAKPGRAPTLVPPDNSNGKRARLQWQALARTDEHTLLQIRLETGRPHQIRLQAADRGHPVVGDTRYGAQTPRNGIVLHHTLLRLDHPGRNRRVTFTAFPPATWRPLLSGEMQKAIERLLAQARPDAPTEPE